MVTVFIIAALTVAICILILTALEVIRYVRGDRD